MNEREKSDRLAYYFGYYPETPEGIPPKELELREYLSSLAPTEAQDFCRTLVNDSRLLLAGPAAAGTLPDYLQEMVPLAPTALDSRVSSGEWVTREAWIKRIDEIASQELSRAA